jgi:hypothetical protein
MAMVWGCPWHGLVTDYELTTAASAVKPWNMSGSRPYQMGSTHLVQAPGAVPIVRSAEEAAIDAANGWEWRNQALLGGRDLLLHNTPLDGWIYCAPDGSRWVIDRHVTGVPLGGALWAGTLNAARFGQFDTTADVRAFGFSLDPGQSAIFWAGSYLTTELHAVSPDGSQAIFMAAYTARYTDLARYLHDQVVPLGFYLVTLSGGISDLAASVTVLYDQAATVGQSSGAFPAESTAPDGSKVSSGAWSAAIIGRIWACWFAGENIEAVTQDMQWSGTLDNPTPTGDPLSRTCNGQSFMTWTLRAGATVIDQITASAVQTISAQIDGPAIGDQSSYSETNTIVFDGDSRVFAVAESWSETTLPSCGPQLLNTWAPSPVSINQPQAGMIVADDPARFYIANVHRYSNNLLGWAVRRLDRDTDALLIDYRPAASPAGVSPGTLTVAGSLADGLIGYLPHGSYNPMTGAMLRNSVAPVCFT